MFSGVTANPNTKIISSIYIIRVTILLPKNKLFKIELFTKKVRSYVSGILTYSLEMIIINTTL